MTTRRTKAEIRAARIAELARKKRELADLLKAEQREAAKEAKRALEDAQTALGRAIAEALGIDTAEGLEGVLDVLVADGALDRVKALLASGDEVTGEPAEGDAAPESDDAAANAAEPASEAVDETAAPVDDSPEPVAAYRPW